MIIKETLISGNTVGQKRLVLLSALLAFAFLFFVLFQFSFGMLLLLFVALLLLGVLNFYASRYFDVSVEGDFILFDNLWAHKEFSRKSFRKINLVHTIVPYPSNPFMVLIFDGEVRVYSKISDPMLVYLAEGGVRLYLSTLQAKIKPPAG